MKLGLTPQMRRALDFISAEIERGVTPSFAEIGAHLGVRSKASVGRLVSSLAARGHIAYFPHKPRSITLVREGYDTESALLASSELAEVDALLAANAHKINGNNSVLIRALERHAHRCREKAA